MITWYYTTGRRNWSLQQQVRKLRYTSLINTAPAVLFTFSYEIGVLKSRVAFGWRVYIKAQATAAYTKTGILPFIHFVSKSTYIRMGFEFPTTGLVTHHTNNITNWQKVVLHFFIL